MIYFFKTSGLFRYSLEVLERKWSNHPFPLYECIGGIALTPNKPDEQNINMADVLDVLYQKALKLAQMYIAWGRPPSFDLKLIGNWHTYWIHAGYEGPAHVLTFYRRPRFFASINRGS